MISLKEFFSFKSNRFFWLNLIAMVAVVIASIFGVLEWLDSYTRHGESILVPNVKGLPLQQAKEEMIQKDLEVLVVDSNYVKEMPAGSVLEQNPDGDSKVKKGRTVYLIINTNSIPKVTIPDIIDNSSYRQAEARLRALGFKMTEPELIEGEKDWFSPFVLELEKTDWRTTPYKRHYQPTNPKMTNPPSTSPGSNYARIHRRHR